MKQYVRRLTKTSEHSFYVIVPKVFVKKYNWKERQKLELEDKGRGRIEIRVASKK